MGGPDRRHAGLDPRDASNRHLGCRGRLPLAVGRELLFRKVRGVDGMGNGDFKLLAGLCAWLGWPMLLPIILASSIVGAVVGIGLKLTGGLREGGYVPFGPFLAAAGVAVMFIGSPAIIDWFGWNL